eukprot:6407180-Karenia_brevis.AAC.1
MCLSVIKCLLRAIRYPHLLVASGMAELYARVKEQCLKIPRPQPHIQLMSGIRGGHLARGQDKKQSGKPLVRGGTLN